MNDENYDGGPSAEATRLDEKRAREAFIRFSPQLNFDYRLTEFGSDEDRIEGKDGYLLRDPERSFGLRVQRTEQKFGWRVWDSFTAREAEIARYRSGKCADYELQFYIMGPTWDGELLSGWAARSDTLLKAIDARERRWRYPRNNPSDKFKAVFVWEMKQDGFNYKRLYPICLDVFTP